MGLRWKGHSSVEELLVYEFYFLLLKFNFKLERFSEWFAQKVFEASPFFCCWHCFYVFQMLLHQVQTTATEVAWATDKLFSIKINVMLATVLQLFVKFLHFSLPLCPEVDTTACIRVVWRFGLPFLHITFSFHLTFYCDFGTKLKQTNPFIITFQ